MRDSISFLFFSTIITFMCIATLAACTTAQNEDQGDKNNQAMEAKYELKEDEQIYWVNSLRVPCEGVGAMQCLQVQQGEEIQPDQWQLFYAPIEGFDYEAGYMYKLIVKEEQRPSDQVPADASSIKYSLVSLLSKEADPKIKLHDIWVLETIGGEVLDRNKIKDYPRMEIDLSNRRVMGFDGCNNFNGSIEAVDSSTLIFGTIAATRKMCVNMQIPDQFNQLMKQVSSYRIENMVLYLYDEKQQELLSFQKTD